MDLSYIVIEYGHHIEVNTYNNPNGILNVESRMQNVDTSLSWITNSSSRPLFGFY